MKLNRLRVVACLALLCGVLAASSCRKVVTPSETRDVMGTKVTITIYDEGLKPDQLKTIYDDAFKLMTELDRSALRPGVNNEVRAISKGAGVQSVPVGPDVFELLTKAFRLYDLSGKVFDIRYGPMLDLWGFDSKPRVPTQAELDSVKTLVGEGGMFVAGTSILLGKPGMRFDVREIAIGHALDAVATKLAQHGVHTAMIASPRVARTMGDPPDKRGFRFTLADSRSGENPWATAWVPVGGFAFADANVDRFELGGKGYCSLLDPRTGMPAATCIAAAVQTTDAATAQALAYSLFVLGGTKDFAPDGQKAVLGNVIVRGEPGKLQAEKSGSLAERFELIK